MSAAVLQSESHADKETTLALGGAEGRDQSAENLCNFIVTHDHQKGNPEATQSTTEGIPSESSRPVDSMAVQIDAVDTITVLTSKRRRLAKLWTSLADKPQGYEDAKQVSVAEHRVSGIWDLAHLLETIQPDPYSCIVRGRFIGHDAAAELYDAEIEADARRGRALERPRAGYTLRRLRFFDDQPLHYCFIDVDKFAPTGVDPITQPVEACDQYIAKHLPDAFQGVSYWWQLSGSAGHPSAAGVLKAHLVFWLSRPYTSEEMEAWARDVPGVDETVFRRVQVNYTAAPVFASGVADPVPVRSGLVEGWFSDAVDLVIKPQVRERARRTRVARREMVDPRDKDNLIGLFCRTFEIEEVVERWLADVFEFVTDDRLTFLQGGGSAEGACVTDNRQGIFNSHASDPLGGRAANKWDLVRHYVFGHLDEGLDADERALLGPGGWPSQEAMREMVLGLPEIQQARGVPDSGLNGRVLCAGPLSILGVDALLKQPRVEWLVKGVLPVGGFAVLFGESGAGKTFLILDLVLALARGVDWCNRKVCPGGVLYVAGEGSAGFGQRLQAYEKHHDVDLSHVPFGAIVAGVALLDGDAARVIEACCRMRHAGHPIKLVVLDTLNRSMGGGDENSSQDMGKYIRAVGDIARETGATVLVVHHTGKDLTRGARGHSSLRAAVDTELELRIDGDTQVLRLTKSRDGRDGIEFVFRREKVVLGHDEDLDEISSCVVVPITRPGGSRRMPKVPGSASIALQALHRCLDRLPPCSDARVPVGAWRAEAFASGISGSEDPLSRRRAFDRARERLLSDGIIACRDDLYSLTLDIPTGRTTDTP